MKKSTKYILFLLLLGLMSCQKMDYNYLQYIEKAKVYAPKISNLQADVGLRYAKLKWDNPQSSIAEKIVVNYQQDSILFDTMIDSCELKNLEIINYTIKVFVIDKYGNYSVPESIQIFPNGENN